jgi:hypothetical protein
MVYLSRKIPTLAGMEVDVRCTPPSTTVSIAPNLVKPGSQWVPDPDPVVVDLPDLAHFTPVNRYAKASGDTTLEAAIGLRHAGKSQQPFSSLGVASSVLRRSPTAGALSYYLATAMVSSRYDDLPIDASMRLALTGISGIPANRMDGYAGPQSLASRHTPERMRADTVVCGRTCGGVASF